jgi:hypothetical protein
VARARFTELGGGSPDAVRPGLRIRPAYAGLAAAAALVITMSSASAADHESVVAETHLLKNAQTAPKSTCAYDAKAKAIACVFIEWSDPSTRVDLYEIDSLDDGVHWTKPHNVTSSPGDEYDPYLAYDSRQGKYWLIYAIWHEHRGGNHNDIAVRSKDCLTCAWSSESIVVADGQHDYWIPSILPLYDGALLAFYSKDGPESAAGAGSGRIAVKRSTDSGRSWSAESLPTDTCDAEYPRAAQNALGGVLLVFGRYVDSSHLKDGTKCADGMNGRFPYSDIHQIWSNDGGRTWSGESVLFHISDGSALHPYVSTESAQQQTPCRSCKMDILFIKPERGFAVFRLQSLDQGLSWNGPTRVSESSWNSPFDVDPGLIAGCDRILANYSAGFGAEGIYVRPLEPVKLCP